MNKIKRHTGDKVITTKEWRASVQTSWRDLKKTWTSDICCYIWVLFPERETLEEELELGFITWEQKKHNNNNIS